MLQKLITKKEKGFTLIELMIVIAIIGILAAIAVPQFLTYRLRSYNTAAKGIVHNLKADNGNLNSELGNYGWTEDTEYLLQDPTDDQGVANTVGPPTGAGSTALRLAATSARAGARLAGRNLGKEYSVGISLGDNMIADVRGGAQYICVARHYKGDTAYGIDADVENQLFSVSNPTWTSRDDVFGGIMATMPASNSNEDDFSGFPGGGAPTGAWMPTQ